MEREDSAIFIGILVGVIFFFSYMSDHHPQFMSDINPTKERIVIQNALGKEDFLIITHLSTTITIPPGETKDMRVPLGHVLTGKVVRGGKVIGTTETYWVPNYYQDDRPWRVRDFSPLR